MDRLLIKRLVSRAEQRAAALDGGPVAMEPVVASVLSEQELTEVTVPGLRSPAAAGGAANKRGGPAMISHMRRASYGRDKLLKDDFNVDDGEAAPYDEMADLRHLEPFRGREEEQQQYAAQERGANRRKFMEKLNHAGDSATAAASQDITNLSEQRDAYDRGFSRPKHLSGIQHASSEQAEIVISEIIPSPKPA